MKRKLLTGAELTGLLAFLLCWLVYFWQDYLSKLGDYRWFPYRFHEVCSLGVIVLPFLSLVWFITVFSRAVQQKTLRKKALILVLLAALLVGQTGYRFYLSQRHTVSTLTEILQIPDEYHIVVECAGGTITLETSPLVPPLLKTDGTRYWIHYETNDLHPQRGTLFSAALSE